ncbi:MAG: hypothetical protein HC877_17885 [Thioploca sp.]|nr:hypothetical protein [Thioploca sp.]
MKYFTLALTVAIYFAHLSTPVQADTTQALNYLHQSLNRYHNSFYVYHDADAGGNHFIPSGWMGDYQTIQFSRNAQILPYSGATCIEIQYHPENNQAWAGIYWQYPEKNWGEFQGLNLSGATVLTFYARGAQGGEKAEFKFGGIGSAEIPVHLKPGSSMVYSYKVTNVGDSEETYNIEAIATKTWANFLGLPTSIKLEPNEFATFNIQITIPIGTSSDESDLLIVRAYSSSNSAIEDTIETSILISVTNAINLLDFNQVGNVLTWTTASEVNNAGYYVWVGIPTLGQCGDENTQYDRVRKLTNELIPAKGGLSEGAFYTYEVPPSESNVTLCYGIEDINTEGLSTFYIIPIFRSEC